MNEIKIVKLLAQTLTQLPSEQYEDYPKSVPKYVVDRLKTFNNRYRTNVGYVKKTISKLNQENEELKELVKEAYKLADYTCKTKHETKCDYCDFANNPKVRELGSEG